MLQKTLAVPLSDDELKAIADTVTALELQVVELVRHCREQRAQAQTGTPGQSEPSAPSIPAARLEAISAAIAALEARFDKMVRLSDEGRRRLVKLDEKSEAFCRETLATLAHNRDQLPPDFDLDSALAALRTRDALRPINERLRRLSALFGK